MKKIIPLVLICLGFAGCTTIVKPQVGEQSDQEPILVGEPMSKRVAVATNDINNQLELLNKINSGKYVGTFSMVTHNNQMDARKGSSKTIPQSYSNDTKKSESLKEEVSSTPAVKDKIKKIDWKNGSLNDLVKSFGVATGYQVILVNDKKDKNINFNVENENVFTALTRLKNQVSSFALLTVVEKNKVIYLNYN